MTYTLEDLLHLMARLRDPQYGCPWDLKQDYASIVPHTIEEAYEVADTIERGDFEHLQGELGDLLFQVVYYSQLAREEGRFEFDGVVDSITRKLIRRHPHADAGDDAVPEREALLGSFGLIPHWSKDDKIARHTYNARSETADTKPNFRDAWRRGQRCIVPAECVYLPHYDEAGKATRWQVARADGAPMGIAGLWSLGWSHNGAPVPSFAMLTVNADDHGLGKHFHKPGDERRMVVILLPFRLAFALQVH